MRINAPFMSQKSSSCSGSRAIPSLDLVSSVYIALEGRHEIVSY